MRAQVRARGGKAARLALPLATQSRQHRDEALIPIRERTRIRPSGSALTILSNLLGADWFQDLNLEDSLDDSRLKIVVEVTYDRRTTDAGQGLLDGIAMSFRNLDEDEAVIKLNHGGKLKGNDLKIYGSITVNTYGGLIDQSDLYPKMHT